MNIHPDSTAPAAPAERRAGELRPDDSLVASLLLLLVALLGRAALPRCLVLLRRILGRALGRPRARAATLAQHRRALRDLRAFPARALYVRAHPFRAPRAARRRIAECFRMLVMPPRRRPGFARPASAQRPRRHAPRPLRALPHARAGPSPPRSAPRAASRPHIHFVAIPYYSDIIPPVPCASVAHVAPARSPW